MAPILGLNQTLSDNTNLASLLSEPMFEGDYTLKADRLTFHEPSHVKIPCTFTRETKSMIVMNKLVQSESEVISTSKPSQSSSSTPASIKTTSRKNTTITSPGITITTSPTNARPIVVDNPKDAASVRRARNTEAARRSRAKKTDRIRELELMVDQLMEHNTKLQCEVEVLRQYKWHV
ncbi:hypothetical protein NADFUDRAFT_68540 [Nadsonia fulvescens var. elongata DSM 6958]|uniref:BZIP domain-containing protein n=1 Tax=Nadsonia fulvescens var. elongata DSM 6958 TaxID=857566 RepID=A0A1E3PTX0_9ASCO|nr:hypothetical protein NADFUDRAFT_68540 [Nadsonia fulvescens var. elongata DSM 6958]